MHKILVKSAVVLSMGAMMAACETYNPAYNGVNASYNRYCGGNCQQYQVNSANTCCNKDPQRQMVMISRNYLNGEYNGYGFYNQDYNPSGYYTTWYTYYR